MQLTLNPAGPSLPAFGRGFFKIPATGRIVPNIGTIVHHKGTISPDMEVFLILLVGAALWLWVGVPV